MNVAEQFQQLGIFLDEERLEAVLKDVACPPVPPVEADGVPGVEGPHEVGQWCPARPEYEVEVIRQQSPGEHLGAGGCDQPARRATNASRSTSSTKMRRRSTPRAMTWCRHPGASRRGPRGMATNACSNTCAHHYDLHLQVSRIALAARLEPDRRHFVAEPVLRLSAIRTKSTVVPDSSLELTPREWKRLWQDSGAQAAA